MLYCLTEGSKRVSKFSSFSVFRIPVMRAGGRDFYISSWAGGRDFYISSFICVFNNLLACPQTLDQKSNDRDLKFKTHYVYLKHLFFNVIVRVPSLRKLPYIFNGKFFVSVDLIFFCFSSPRDALGPSWVIS